MHCLQEILAMILMYIVIITTIMKRDTAAAIMAVEAIPAINR